MSRSLRKTGLVALLLFAVALAVRLYRLDAQSLWLDEGSTWQMIQSGWLSLFGELFYPPAGYPLYHVLLKAWVAIAGDSEWALRLPSALAGAATAPMLYLLAYELARDVPTVSERAARWYGVAPVALLIVSPFAIWYAQDAKVYSLLLLWSTVLLWLVLRAVRAPTRQAWLVFLAVAVLGVFVHRLAVLLVLGGWLAVLLVRPRVWGGFTPRMQVVLLVVAAVLTLGAMGYGLDSDLAATGAYIAADPLTAVGLAFVRFSIDRGPGQFPWWWLVPWAMLAVLGGATLLYTAVRGERVLRGRARVLLAVLLLPLLLFLTQLAFTRLYETRYLMMLYPVWLLLLTFPLLALPTLQPRPALRLHALSPLLVVGALLVLAASSGVLSLRQPQYGLFSGDPVKEQFREAIETLATNAHPDDAIILHPIYLQPLYDYYMHRFSRDEPPPTIGFAAFKHLQTAFNQRDWDQARRDKLAGYLRSWLLIAPEHAATVDRPVAASDEYGLVGLYYRYSREQQKWSCGIWRHNGAHLYCQDSPEAYITGAEATPATLLPADFGGELWLKGYTLKATVGDNPGVYRAGGTLPITLFWDVPQPPSQNYVMFLHLCQQCDAPPPASSDGEPLQGYLPTTTWTPGNPVHDERTVVLPADLPPGEYQLLLGMYRPDMPTEADRIPITSDAAPVLSPQRLLLTTIQIVNDE